MSERLIGINMGNLAERCHEKLKNAGVPDECTETGCLFVSKVGVNHLGETQIVVLEKDPEKFGNNCEKCPIHLNGGVIIKQSNLCGTEVTRYDYDPHDILRAVLT